MKFAAREIHAQIGPAWPAVLAQLGIDETFLRPKKAGPCPACGGRDRYTFDNRNGHGDFFCRGCGAGDGFAILQRVHGWSFTEALHRVVAVAGLAVELLPQSSASRAIEHTQSAPADPTRRVREILRHTCEPGDVEDAVNYLRSRNLWPLPCGLTLRAHASVEYWHKGKRLGRFAALVAAVRDISGTLASAHVTYLQRGRKLESHTPRKILSPLSGRVGCAVRLLPVAGDTLAVAEGLETAIAAHCLHELPTWSALNAGLLAKFEPPPAVRTLVVFADRDAPGLEAAARLMEHLQGRVRVELRVPSAPAKDWNDVLVERAP